MMTGTALRPESAVGVCRHSHAQGIVSITISAQPISPCITRPWSSTAAPHTNVTKQIDHGRVFARQRSETEAGVAGQEQGSTENLRLAFRSYRSFFERLLSL